MESLVDVVQFIDTAFGPFEVIITFTGKLFCTNLCVAILKDFRTFTSGRENVKILYILSWISLEYLLPPNVCVYI